MTRVSDDWSLKLIAVLLLIANFSLFSVMTYLGIRRERAISECVETKRLAGMEDRYEFAGLGPYGIPQYRSSLRANCLREVVG